MFLAKQNAYHTNTPSQDENNFSLVQAFVLYSKFNVLNAVTFLQTWSKYRLSIFKNYLIIDLHADEFFRELLSGTWL